jgi:hypothetical protein
MPMIVLPGGGVERDRKRREDEGLVLLTAAQGLLHLQFLAAHPQVLHEKTALFLALPADLLRLAEEVDEDVDLRLQDQRLDRFEHVIDGTG